MVDGKSSSWEQAAPTSGTPTPPPLSGQTTVNPREPHIPDSAWGAAPVAVPRGTGGRVRAVAAEGLAAPSPARALAFGPTELLRLRDRERLSRVRAIEHAGWPGPRTILVASLYGGVGVSTIAAQLAWSGRVRGLPTVLLDASEAYGTGAAARIPDAAQMTQRPSWADLARTLYTGGPDGLTGAFSERLPGLEGAVPVLTGGRQSTDELRHRPPADLLAGGVQAAQLGGWPLVVVDHGAGAVPLTLTLGGFDPDLLVLVTRGDVAEVRESAAFLRHLAASGVRGSDRTVLVVAHDGRIGRSVAAARASVLDAAAGSIDAPWTDRLRDRTSTVDGVPPAISLLMAATALSTPTQPQRSGRSTR